MDCLHCKCLSTNVACWKLFACGDKRFCRAGICVVYGLLAWFFVVPRLFYMAFRSFATAKARRFFAVTVGTLVISAISSMLLPSRCSKRTSISGFASVMSR